MSEYDAVVVGASIAGSTAAILLGRAGLRVALIERRTYLDAFKTLCTHHVMACATPTIRRIGLDGAIEAAGVCPQRPQRVHPDAIAPALLEGRSIERALRRYDHQRRLLNGHQSTIEQEAKAEPPTPLDRLMLQAAAHDPKTAAHVFAYFNRTITLTGFLRPTALARAAWVRARDHIPKLPLRQALPARSR